MIGSTTYGPGTRTTATDVGPIPQGVNMAGIYDLFRRMTAARSAAAAPATGPRPIGGVNAASGSRLNRPASVVSPPRDPLAALKAEAAAQQIQESMRPAPMRMTTFGAGANNSYMPDVNAMTANQRQMFLPQNAEVPEGESRRQALEDAREAEANASWHAKNPGDGPYTGSPGVSYRR